MTGFFDRLFGGSRATTSGDLSPALVAGRDANLTVEGYSAEQVQRLIAEVRSIAELSARQAKELREEVGALSCRLGATEQGAVALLRMLGDSQVDGEHVLERLGQLASRHWATAELIRAMEADDEATQCLLEAAKAANNDGRFDEADAALAEIEALRLKAAEAARSELDRRQLQAAEARASRGAVAMSGMRFVEAAAHFETAGRLLPPGHDAATRGLALLRIAALQRQGEDRGDNAALVQAIEASRTLLAGLVRESTPDTWAEAQIALAHGLISLSNRTGPAGGPARGLEQAIACLEHAAEIYTRAGAPRRWINTRLLLGTALAQLGGRQRESTALEAAAAVYTEALATADAIHDQDIAAVILVNFGAVLREIGRRTPGAEVLERADQAYALALERIDRAKAPFAWATIQHNRANLATSVADRRGSTADLAKAVQGFHLALEERKRDLVPVAWADTQDALGCTLSRLAMLTHDAGTGREAIAAFGQALTVRLAAHNPTARARTLSNLGNIQATLAEAAQDQPLLRQAIDHYTEALGLIERTTEPLSWADAQNNLGNALQALGQLEQDEASLQAAADAFGRALEVWTADRLPVKNAFGQNNLGSALLATAKLAEDKGRSAAPALEGSVQALRLALGVWLVGPMPQDAAGTRLNLAGALRRLAALRRDPAMAEEAVTVAQLSAEGFRSLGLAYWAAQAEGVAGDAERTRAMVTSEEDKP